jgi:putative ABC transport system substrate-binding protein
MSRRREFITLLGGAAAVSWPARLRAEQRSKRLIGLLGAASPASSTPQYQAWVGGLRELGYVEGQDYEIVAKWAFGVMDRLPALAEELVQLKPDVIVAAPTPAVVALHTKTASIPIVSFMLADEVRLGLVASSARPGGNVTGLSMRLDGMVGKQMELATELIPTAKITGVLVNPTSADTANQLAEAKAACATLKLLPVFVEARSPSDISSAFQQFSDGGAQVVVVLYDALFFQERRRIADAAIAGGLPVVYAARDHVTDGGLSSYGISLRANARRVAVYIDKIFKGATPAELPIEFPTQLELVINLKAANAIGLAVPPMLLTRADEVIE